jgi:hypothetical protein
MTTATQISPVALALASLPEGVVSIPIIIREQWLANRENDVTASAVAALVGTHPYQTAFGLHMLKTGQRGSRDAAARRPWPFVRTDGDRSRPDASSVMADFVSRGQLFPHFVRPHRVHPGRNCH